MSDSTFVAVMADLRHLAMATRFVPPVTPAARDTARRDTTHVGSTRRDTLPKAAVTLDTTRDFGPHSVIPPSPGHREAAHRDPTHRDTTHRDTTHRDTTHRDTIRRDTAVRAAFAAESIASQRQRDSVLRHYRVTEPQLEAKARDIARNPAHAVEIVHAIDRKVYGPATPPNFSRPNMPRPFIPPGQRGPMPQPQQRPMPPPPPQPPRPSQTAPAPNAKRTSS